MVALILAILSSAAISVIMRLSTKAVTGRLNMLRANYVACVVLAIVYGAPSFPVEGSLLATSLMGIVTGFLFLASFMIFQHNTRENGVVLSSVFMKLGLLVPMCLSIFLFGEIPGALQILGFALALVAIVLMDMKGGGQSKNKWGLLLLLLAGGCSDAMSKVFEVMGDAKQADIYLMILFATAFILCSILVAVRKERVRLKDVLFGLALGIPNFFSAKFLLASLRTLPAVIVYPTYSVATILVVTLAGILLFKERLEKRQWIALFLILGALALLNI